MLPLLGAGEACDYSEIKMKIKELFDLHLTQNPVVNIVIIIYIVKLVQSLMVVLHGISVKLPITSISEYCRISSSTHNLYCDR